MEQYAPMLTAVFTGIALPGAIWLFLRLKKFLVSQVKDIRDDVIRTAGTTAEASAAAAIAVADMAKLAAADAEARLTVLLERNNADTNKALQRLDAMNGKVATVIAQQAVDHDNVVWLLGRTGEPMDRKSI